MKNKLEIIASDIVWFYSEIHKEENSNSVDEHYLNELKEEYFKLQCDYKLATGNFYAFNPPFN